MKKIFFIPLGVLAFALQSSTLVNNVPNNVTQAKTLTVDLNGTMADATFGTLDNMKVNLESLSTTPAVSQIYSSPEISVNLIKSKETLGNNSVVENTTNNIVSSQDALGPEITFKKTKHEFGTIPQGVPVKTTFTFENTGNSNLVINKATAGCGCTTPTYPKEPIAPGKKGVIEVGYDAKAVGNFVKDVTIETNGGTIKLLITGVVEVIASDSGSKNEIKLPTKKN